MDITKSLETARSELINALYHVNQALEQRIPTRQMYQINIAHSYGTCAMINLHNVIKD